MDFIYLRTFCEVATCGSFTQAAETLGYGQPSVTMQMQKLEEQYGAVLFERYGRRMQLTQAGEVLLPYARQILELQSEAKARISAQDMGTITIGTIETLATFYLPPLLQTFRRAHPGIDAHLPQLTERWETGCYTIAELYRELVANGYTHSYDSVYRQLVRSLPERPKRQLVRPLPQEQEKVSDQLPRPPVLARQAVFLFLRRASELEGEEQETLALLRSLHVEVDQAYELVQQFAQMLRARTGEQLDEWLCRVRTSKIRELQGFVAGVKRDKAAVTAGLTLPQNNGIVEGKVNKLKLIKRMGYGRASFALLRQRVLHAL
jgi:DNA-binding transcriptional LysR family regulator